MDPETQGPGWIQRLRDQGESRDSLSRVDPETQDAGWIQRLRDQGGSRD